jgi:hypothetical protein
MAVSADDPHQRRDEDGDLSNQLVCAGEVCRSGFSREYPKSSTESSRFVGSTEDGGQTGYFDPHFGVLVIQARYDDRVWIYRH